MKDSDSPWKGHGKRSRLRSKRENYNVRADFVVEGRVYTGIVKNKSGTGLFMEALDSFSEGQEITLTVILPSDKKPIKRKGKITRTTSTGFGVEFTFK